MEEIRNFRRQTEQTIDFEDGLAPQPLTYPYGGKSNFKKCSHSVSESKSDYFDAAPGNSLQDVSVRKEFIYAATATIYLRIVAVDC
jgi:hypothetical protein